MLAGLGFIAVFASATNTPLACTLMGIELFGAENMVFYAVPVLPLITLVDIQEFTPHNEWRFQSFNQPNPHSKLNAVI